MPDLYETLIGAPPSGPEETRATAQQLRRQSDVGALGMLTRNKGIAPLGQVMMDESQEQILGLQKSREAGLDNERDQARIDSQTAQWQAANELGWAKLNEEIRNNKADADAALAEGMIPDYKALTDSNRTYMRDKSSLVKHGQTLLDQMKVISDPAFGQGLVPKAGQISNWLAANVPKWTSKTQQQRQAWWAKWDRTYNLKERNLMFGATLTDNEKAVWAAANVNPNMNAEQVAAAIEHVLQKQRTELDMHTQSMQGVYNPSEYNVFRTTAGLDAYDPQAVAAQAAAQATSPTDAKAAADAPALDEDEVIDLRTK